MQTGKAITDSLARVVILTNSSGQERTVRFTNITAADGNFSVKYVFSDVGLYRIITKITSRSHDLTSLASFTVIVPLIAEKDIFWISILIAIAAGIASFLIVKNTVYKD